MQLTCSRGLLSPLRSSDFEPLVHPGPLLRDLAVEATDPLAVLASIKAQYSSRESFLLELERSGLRGRAGGGFPVAWKWQQLASGEDEARFFVCNAHSGAPGTFKARLLLSKNPARVVADLLLASWAVGAQVGILYLGRESVDEQRLLEEALSAVRPRTEIELLVVRSPGGYITGEETALMEIVEGRVGRPRGKPPLPTSKGILGHPTAVTNLETLLHAGFVARHGAEIFRKTGGRYTPGTMVFSLSGDVERPGLYELPLGTPLRTLLYDLGGGGVDGTEIQGVLPGGPGSRILTSEMFDVPMDFDSLTEVDSDLGSGAVIVIGAGQSVTDLAIELGAFFHRASCGKCQPCQDGTNRTPLLSH